MAMTEEELVGIVREVTDAEVDFYREHGWVSVSVHEEMT
jgi:hypothetical protein